MNVQDIKNKTDYLINEYTQLTGKDASTINICEFIELRNQAIREEQIGIRNEQGKNRQSSNLDQEIKPTMIVKSKNHGEAQDERNRSRIHEVKAGMTEVQERKSGNAVEILNSLAD